MTNVERVNRLVEIVEWLVADIWYEGGQAPLAPGVTEQEAEAYRLLGEILQES
jgi:hypothetical protein